MLCYERTNRNMPAGNTVVQLLAEYTDPESQNAQCYRQTDRRQDGANSRSYCVRSAKNAFIFSATLDTVMHCVGLVM